MKLHLKSFFLDQTGRFSGQRRRSYEASDGRRDVEWIRFLFFLDRIDGILFAYGEMPSAKGRSILTIRLILSTCISKIRIHSSSFSIKPTAFQSAGWADT